MQGNEQQRETTESSTRCPCSRKHHSGMPSSPFFPVPTEEKRHGESIRAKIFGIEMKDNAASIIDASKFLNWTLWFYQTPSFASTVFARRGLHIWVLIYMLVGNAAYFIVQDGYRWKSDYPEIQLPFTSAMVSQQMNWARSLMTFVLSTYVVRIIVVYWTGTRSAASSLQRSLSKAVDTICVFVDYDNSRAEKFLRSMHQMATLIGYYSYACAVKNSRFKLSNEQKNRLFEDRGIGSEYLLSIKNKRAVSVLRLAMLQILKEERTREDGCLKNLDPVSWDTLRIDLAQFVSAGMSIMTCTSSNKLPFAYLSLVNWGTKIMSFTYVIYTFTWTAEDHVDSDYQVPFTCWNNHDPEEDETFCPTQFFVLVNVGIAVSLYFIFGMLELYHSIFSMWEDGLSVADYLRNIDLITISLIEKPKTFSDLESTSAVNKTILKHPCSIHPPCS